MKSTYKTIAIITAFIMACGSIAMLAYHLGMRRGEVQIISEVRPKITPTKEEKPISSAVIAALSQESLSLADRLDYLSKANQQLPLPDRAALLKAVSAPPLAGLSLDDSYSFANEILSVLRSQNPADTNLTDALIAIWNDTTLESTIRDYALQHLREWVGDNDVRTTHETIPQKVSKIHSTFISALTTG